MTSVSAAALRRAFVAAAIAWMVALLAAAPLAGGRAGGSAGYLFSALVYAVGGVLCHQRPERSVQLWGAQFPVCARCAGIYAGAVLGALAAVAAAVKPAGGRVPVRSDRVRLTLAAGALPTLLTLVYEWTSGDMPAHVIRALSGVPLGGVVSWVIVRVR
jgi:hypothetical protein